MLYIKPALLTPYVIVISFLVDYIIYLIALRPGWVKGFIYTGCTNLVTAGIGYIGLRFTSSFFVEIFYPFGFFGTFHIFNILGNFFICATVNSLIEYTVIFILVIIIESGEKNALFELCEEKNVIKDIKKQFEIKHNIMKDNEAFTLDNLLSIKGVFLIWLANFVTYIIAGFFVEL
jgi:hypothetical protein